MRRMDQGTAVGLQVTGLGLGIGAVLAGGHARAMEAVQRDRDERAARQKAAYDVYVQFELDEARQELGRARREIARLKNEVARQAALLDMLGAPKL